MFIITSKTLLQKLLNVAPDRIKRTIESLSEDERKVFEYFLQYISVGTIVALKELKALYGIEDPLKVIRALIEKGLLERGSGCYSLSQEIRELLFEVLRSGMR